MLILAILLIVPTTGVLAIWASRHLMIRRERRTGVVLDPASDGPPDPPPMISVVVAAKDEEDNIETCLRTMLAQDYPNYELICADDRSDDATGRIADGIAAEDARLRVVHVRDLPEGWAGKCNAMRQAIGQARGEWICMIDADCRQLSPRTLSTAMQHAMDTGANLLSVLPILEMKGFWENALQPVCSGVMMIWFHPDKVNDPSRPNAYANGAFMLIDRPTYEAVGGHEAVKDKLNEDMHLASAVKSAGRRLRVVRSSDLYLVRMYTSLGAILRGWARIFYGTFGTLRRLTMSFVLMALMGLLPYVSTAVGFAVAASGARPAWAWWTLGSVGAAGAIMQMSVIARYFALVRARPGLFWTYPLCATLTCWTILKSIANLRRGATMTWRNTRYARGN